MDTLTKHALYTASCVLLLAGAARAQDGPSGDAPSGATTAATESARSHFRLGVDFYREGNFRAALIEFQRAYADAPHYKLLYNLGQASLELQEYASAIDFLSAYLRQGGDEITAERRAEVEESIRYLESRIAHVTIVSNRDGAELYVDDTFVGKSPLEGAVRIGAGRHKLAATLPGVATVERNLDVAAGDEREMRLDFVAADAAAVTPVDGAAPAPDQDYHHSGEADYTAPIVLAVVTGTLAIGAVTMSIVTGIAQQDYQEELLVPTTRAKLSDLQEDAQTKALITDVVLGATLASAVVTTVLFLTTDGETDSTARAGQATARNTRHMTLSLGPSGIDVAGRF
jgi:hypothetical protein